MTGARNGPTICLMTADVSGDQNAASLAVALRARDPSLRLLGVGGLAMREAGVDVHVESTELSFMGLFESARMLRQLVHCFRGSLGLVRRERPDLVVLVDSEAATMPMAAWFRRRGIPVVFYFPPQVWLWGRWRLRAMVPLARRFVSPSGPRRSCTRRGRRRGVGRPPAARPRARRRGRRPRRCATSVSIRRGRWWCSCRAVAAPRSSALLPPMLGAARDPRLARPQPAVRHSGRQPVAARRRRARRARARPAPAHRRLPAALVRRAQPRARWSCSARAPRRSRSPCSAYRR